MCCSLLALGLGGGGMSSSIGISTTLGSMYSDIPRGAGNLIELKSFSYGTVAEFGNMGLRRGEVGEFGELRCLTAFSGLCRRGILGMEKWRSDLRVVCRAKRREPAMERSDSANEELLLFFFQLDLTTRLQRALNQDMYDAAQQLREKINEVEQEIARQREAKTGSGSSKHAAQDKAITILQLKAELQRLIEEEDYGGAGAVRKKLTALETESLAAQAKALVYRQLEFHFRLGQKVRHRVFGYRGVICGMDPLCCESAQWAESVGIDQLSRGRNQPFYQVLVDIREEPSLMVTYVAEDHLAAPDEPDLDQFDHPYVYFLFYGMDAAGDFIACKQLREKYSASRHELPFDEGDESPSTGSSGPD